MISMSLYERQSIGPKGAQATFRSKINQSVSVIPFACSLIGYYLLTFGLSQFISVDCSEIIYNCTVKCANSSIHFGYEFIYLESCIFIFNSIDWLIIDCILRVYFVLLTF